MARLLPVLAIVGLGALVGVGVAYAADNEDDKPPPLPPPDEDCLSSKDVGDIASEFLADPTQTPADLRNMAATFRSLNDYCDDGARQAGQAAAVLLETRATQLESGIQPPLPPGAALPIPGGTPVPGVPGTSTIPGLGALLPYLSVPPSPYELPGGHYYTNYGWCPMGMVLDLKTGMCVSPDYEVVTQGDDHSTGACCGSCAVGGPCEGCG